MFQKKDLFWGLLAILLALSPTSEAQVAAFHKRGPQIVKRRAPVSNANLVGRPSSNIFGPHGILANPFQSAAREPYNKSLIRAVCRRAANQQQNHPTFPGKERVDAVIFDMDGTLLDSLPAWGNACADYLRTRGIELPEEMNQKIKTMSLREGAQYLKEQFNLAEPAEELIQAALGQVRQHYATDILAKPGVLPLLEHLKKQGIRVCVATSSDKEFARLAFERLGLMPYIDFIISCDDVGHGKYSPAIYNEAVMRLGASKTRTLVVEDALYAVETAKKAGFITAGIAESYHPLQHEHQRRHVADYFFVSWEHGVR